MEKPKLNKKGSVLPYRAPITDVSNDYISPSTNTVYQELEDFSISGRKRPWKEKKSNSCLISDGYDRLSNLIPNSRDYFQNKADRISNCGTWLEFHSFDDGTKNLHRAFFCKQRLCAVCNWRRSLKIFSQVTKIMDGIQAENDYEYLFLTLTVKNVDGPLLYDTVSDLISGYLKLIRKTIVKRSVLGAFRAIEITYNRKSNQFHPHIHVVLCVKKDYFKNYYIKNQLWSELWKDCMNLDYNPVIDVRKTYGDKTKSVAEVAKYATKDEDLMKRDENGNKIADEEVIFILDEALRGRRLISYSGIFKDYQQKLKLQDPEDGDLIHIDDEVIRPDLKYIVETYSWRCGTYSRIDNINKTA